MESAWRPGGRDALLASLRDGAQQPWDLIIVGGGITGAGILREAARQGWRALLVEQRDFAWGTSSRSSKMVHGGLRYLAQGDFGLTRDAVRERQRLLQEAPGLVEPLRFLMPHYRGQFPGPRLFQTLLAFYDRMAGQKLHQRLPASDAPLLVPHLKTQGLKALSLFTDAVTDDARLVLRVLQEARQAGGVALNYLAAESVVLEEGMVRGLRLRDRETGEAFAVRARALINATGAWTDRLREQIGGERRIRPLRGSHLVLPFWRLPLAWSVSFLHPRDRRPVFAFPWEGMTVVGTTDLDHDNLEQEARITEEEVEYLLNGVNSLFPQAGIGRGDVVATYAGVRPVVAGSARDPSKEKREHAIWDEHGLISVAGGKLTTFRLIALDVLRVAEPYVNKPLESRGDGVIFTKPDAHLLDDYLLPAGHKQRLLGRYGAAARQLLDEATPRERETVAGSDTLWAELRWSCRHEAVVHLDDLLLRRCRLGLLLPQGGLGEVKTIERLCKQNLGWDDARWQRELANYRQLWARCYSLPSGKEDEIPSVDGESVLEKSAGEQESVEGIRAQ